MALSYFRLPIFVFALLFIRPVSAQITPPDKLVKDWEKHQDNDSWFRRMGTWTDLVGLDTLASFFTSVMEKKSGSKEYWEARFARALLVAANGDAPMDYAELAAIEANYRKENNERGLARLYAMRGRSLWIEKNYDAASLTYDTAVVFYTKVDEPAELIDLHHMRMTTETGRGNIRRADTISREAELLFPFAEKDSGAIIAVLQASVPVAGMLRDYERARWASVNCLDYYLARKYKSRIVTSAFNLSLVETLNANYPASLEALAIAEANLDTTKRDQVLAIYAAKANYQLKAGDYEGAMNTALKWLPIAENEQNLGQVAAFAYTVGTALVNGNPPDYLEGVKFLKQGIEAAEKVNAIRQESMIRSTLGETYSVMGNHRFAIDEYEKSAALMNGKIPDLTINAIVGQIISYLELEKTDKATDLVTSLNAIPISARDFQKKKNKFKALYKYHKALGNYTEMSAAVDSLQIVSDSLNATTLNDQLQTMNAKFKVDEEKAKSALLEQSILAEQAINERQTLLVALFGLIAVMLASGVLFLRRRAKEKERYTTELEIKNTEISRQKEEIRSTHISHTHDTINQFTDVILELNLQQNKLENQGVDLGTLLATRQQLLSYKTIQELVRENESSQVSLLQYLDLYCAAITDVHSRSNGNLSIDYQCPDVVVKASFAAKLGRIINELITNSAKYAQRNGGLLYVTLKVDKISDEEIRLTYSDPGPADDADLEIAVYSSESGVTIIRELTEYMDGAIEQYAEESYDFSAVFPLK